MRREQITVEPDGAGKRLDRFLVERLKDISRSQLQRLITDGAVLLNGETTVKRQMVAVGDCIDVEYSLVALSREGTLPQPQNIPLEILYEDAFLLAVNKPAGLVVHPGNGNRDGTLVNALLHRGQSLATGFSPERPGIVHRLDKDTSGVVLVAKMNRIHTRLAAAFASRTVSKQYLGFCIGRPWAIRGTIDLPLERSRREPVKRTVAAGGKDACTRYELEIYRSGISLLCFHPRTGRTHQIRVHCSSSGFPILADSLYGGGKDRIIRIEPGERPFAYSVYKCFSRHALHARRIIFDHPETGESLNISAPLPDDFKNALRMFNDPEMMLQFGN